MQGIYKGENHPFIICHFTNTDSLIEVEYFYKKGSPLFSHSAPKKLANRLNSHKNFQTLASADDSIKVYLKDDHYLIKRIGCEKMKVYKTGETRNAFISLRNKAKLHQFTQKLHQNNKTNSNYKSQELWDKIHSYELEKQTHLTEAEFQKKLDEVRLKLMD